MVQIDEKAYGLSKERVEAFFDAGTFVELGAYTKRLSSEDEYEGVVCGYGAVEGKLVFAFVQDSGRSKGAFGERHAKKIADMYALAIKNGAPVVGIFDSAGASVYDGATALAAYGRFMSVVSEASGLVPQIAIIDGVCGGASSVVASMFDITVTVNGKAKLFVNAPFNVGAAQSSAEQGLSALSANSEEEAFAFVRSLVNILPSNNAESALVDCTDDINRTVALPEDMNAEGVLAAICDNGRFIELYGDYTDKAKLGFASFGGMVAGVVACDNKKDGILDIKFAKAASKLITFCDSFDIPVITLVDSKGLDVSLDAENQAYASELAKLAYAYTSSDNAKVTVVLGKAYGTAFTLLGSKSVGADIAYALPEAAISVLSPEASVAFVWNDKVGEKSREELEAEWTEKCASAANACDAGEIDDVIAPEELRKRICSALSMLLYKSEGLPARKHANMPL